MQESESELRIIFNSKVRIHSDLLKFEVDCKARMRIH